MAKKNSKKALFDLVTLVLTGGIYGLLALPFVKAEASALGWSTSSVASGYSLLDFEANSGVATVILLMVIFAGIAAFSSLCKLVFDGGFLKSKSASKFLGFGAVLFSLALVGAVVAAMIVIPQNCSSSSLGSLASASTNPQWGTLIGCLAASLLALGTSFKASK